jgi:hypothetical protein
MLISPALAIVPITAIPAHNPPSSDRYDVIWFGALSLGPPPEMIISSSFFTPPSCGIPHRIILTLPLLQLDLVVQSDRGLQVRSIEEYSLLVVEHALVVIGTSRQVRIGSDWPLARLPLSFLAFLREKAFLPRCSLI